MIYHTGGRFGLDEEEQSLIYWKCRNFFRLSKREREAIDKIIEECADGAKDALFEMLTTRRNITNVAMRHHISESSLQARCAKFYREAAKRL